ncbi:phosphatidylserine decarboxylase [Methylohalomonas lacus]|uniref:Phosphatidylserine decarboxylase n=1 Tax=Methylohalomonas lacus TaxID=398773 RepID=A0AAE3HM94_9GAMM|nr:phosphatidylserine decarboxylase [Methylohalomonas lacus]MCS3903903.1 phosphatidylserine decarboxylase [Methylohalomonas lacus]
MPSNSYPIIAREGWFYVVLIAAVALLVKIYVSLAAGIGLLALLAILLVLLRDPPRSVPSVPSGLVSPVHGHVVDVNHVTDIWLKRPSTHIRLRMSPLDIYSLRCPIEGRVMDQKSGRDHDNPHIRQYAFWLRTDEGDDVVVSIRMGWLPKRARLYVQSGERLGQGQRCGYIYFGGEVDLWLPEHVRLDIENGQPVVAGSMLLGKLVHRHGASITDVDTVPAARAS